MIKILLTVRNPAEAAVLLYRLRENVIKSDDNCYLGEGGVWIETYDPVRVSQGLVDWGFIPSEWQKDVDRF